MDIIEAVYRVGRKIGVLILLTGCVTGGEIEPIAGLEDIVLCRFNTDQGQEYTKTIERMLNKDSPDYSPVSPALKRYYDDGKTNLLRRLPESKSVFGGNAPGFFVFSMHGAYAFGVLVELPVAQLRQKLEERTGRNYRVGDNDLALSDSGIGPDRWFFQNDELGSARVVIVPSPNNDNVTFMVCALDFPIRAPPSYQ